MPANGHIDESDLDDEFELPAALEPASPAEQIQATLERWRDFSGWGSFLLVAVGAFAVTWYLMRPQPEPPPLPDATLPFATAVPTPEPTPHALVVHVAGAVGEPGVFTVLEGARVLDVVELAGGLSATADLAQVNLAGLVVDGERIWIPATGEEEPPLTVGTADPNEHLGSEPETVDINSGSASDLEQLPGVGPSTSAAIVTYRENNGPFTTVDDLMQVPGIGPAKLESIRPQATV